MQDAFVAAHRTWDRRARPAPLPAPRGHQPLPQLGSSPDARADRRPRPGTGRARSAPTSSGTPSPPSRSASATAIVSRFYLDLPDEDIAELLGLPDAHRPHRHPPRPRQAPPGGPPMTDQLETDLRTMLAERASRVTSDAPPPARPPSPSASSPATPCSPRSCAWPVPAAPAVAGRRGRRRHRRPRAGHRRCARTTTGASTPARRVTTGDRPRPWPARTCSIAPRRSKASALPAVPPSPATPPIDERSWLPAGRSCLPATAARVLRRLAATGGRSSSADGAHRRGAAARRGPSRCTGRRASSRAQLPVSEPCPERVADPPDRQLAIVVDGLRPVDEPSFSPIEAADRRSRSSPRGSADARGAGRVAPTAIDEGRRRHDHHHRRRRRLQRRPDPRRRRRSAKDVAERVMREVLGDESVTMEAADRPDGDDVYVHDGDEPGSGSPPLVTFDESPRRAPPRRLARPASSRRSDDAGLLSDPAGGPRLTLLTGLARADTGALSR